MSRENDVVLYLQGSTKTDDGIEPVATWESPGSPYSVTLVPASNTVREVAQAIQLTVTHTALVPYGLELDPRNHRFVQDPTGENIRYDIVELAGRAGNRQVVQLERLR